MFETSTLMAVFVFLVTQKHETKDTFSPNYTTKFLFKLIINQLLRKIKNTLSRFFFFFINV